MCEKPWAPASPPVTADTLPELLAGPGVVLIHVWAIWDITDRWQDRYIQQVRTRFEPPAQFFALDSDDQELWPFLHEWAVLNVPTVLCFVNGALHERVVGCRLPDELDTRLRGWLAAAQARSGES